MSTNDTYLAIFLGSKTSPKRKAWDALPEAERRAKEGEGIAAWKAWVEKHQGAIVGMGGPLGKTKKVTERGIEDVSNALGAFTVVRAKSHEAAAKLFENHPHFTMFPGEIRRGHAGPANTGRLIEGSGKSLVFWRSMRALAAGQPLMTAVVRLNVTQCNKRSTAHAATRALRVITTIVAYSP